MKELQIGEEKEMTFTVKENMLALAVGSGNVRVLATPMMVMMMEQCAAALLSCSLDPGETSVGIHIETTHCAATPAGSCVTVTAQITGQERRQVRFAVTAHDEQGLIGEGVHSRVVVIKERFEQKALERNQSPSQS